MQTSPSFRAIANYQNLFPIGLGAMPLSLHPNFSEKDAISVIHCFLEQSGNFIDTADVYGLTHADRGHNRSLREQSRSGSDCFAVNQQKII